MYQRALRELRAKTHVRSGSTRDHVDAVYGKVIVNSLKDLIEKWRSKAQQRKDRSCSTFSFVSGEAAGLRVCADEIEAYLVRCAYRLGPPSAKEVRAHEKRGGWWMRKSPSRNCGPVTLVELRVVDGQIEGRYSNGSWGWRDVDMICCFPIRPCSPDADALSWLGPAKQEGVL